jgi:tetratricopeptide (TPR) repeat protein
MEGGRVSGGLMVVAGRAPLLLRFVNRDVDVAAVLDLLEGRENEPTGVVGLSGLPGVGKTALAVRVAALSQHRFPGGQLYLDFKAYRGREGCEDKDVAISDALVGCLIALGLAPETIPSSLPQLVSLFRRRTSEQAMLVILENVAEPDQISELLPAAPGSAALVTSVARFTDLGLNGAFIYRLEPVDVPHGIRMLTEMCRQRVLTGARGVGELAAACGGFPLTLRVSAARLVMRPGLEPADIAKEITDRRRGLDVFDLSGQNPYAADLQLAYNELPEDAAWLYRLLGTLPIVDFTADVVSAVMRTGLRLAENTIDLLHEAGLIEALAGRRYSLHDVVWRHAADRARAQDSDADRILSVRSMVEFLLVRAASADRAILGSGRFRCTSHAQLLGNRGDLFKESDGPSALKWMDRERWNLMVALQTAVEHGWNDLAWQLAEAMTALYVEMRYLVSWTESANLGAKAALLAQRPDAAARLLSFSSRAWTDLDEPDRAWSELQNSFVLCRDSKLNDRRLLASIHELAGRYHDHIGGHDVAQQQYRQAIDLFSAEGDSRGVAFVTLFLGRSMHAEGRLRDARRVLEDAVARIRAEGSTRMEGRALMSLAQVTADVDTPGAAMSMLNQAIVVLRDGEHAFHELAAHLVRADLAEDRLGEREPVRESLSRAVELDTALGGARHGELIERLERLEREQGDR